MWREINDTALLNLDAWVPALRLPQTHRNHNGYRAVAAWRGVENANLAFHATGIKDWGEDKSYTPIDCVMAALSVDLSTAAQWLSDQLGLEMHKSDDFDMAGFIERTRAKVEPPVMPDPDAEEPRADGAPVYVVLMDQHWSHATGFGLSL
jgi:hypothetical protein